MWKYQYLKRLDFRVLPIILCLMGISLLIISSYSLPSGIDFIDEEPFMTPYLKSQIKGFLISIAVFIFFAGFDYNKLREWTWILYAIMMISLIGLFFTHTIASVHRWYRIPILNMSFQPCEFAKLVVVISLSWLLERRAAKSENLSTALLCGLIVGFPFILILKQPDLGSALVLFPITLGIFYFGNAHPTVIKCMTYAGTVAFLCVAIFFLGIVSHEEWRPLATRIIKEYQYERLNPNTHHQKASATAIALGGMTGAGWRKSQYTSGGWLPAPYTDSVFPAFAEEFGLLGLGILLGLFYTLIYLSFQVTLVAKDHFGRLLAAGVSVYLAMHILVNIGMMTGFLPITGVPLILVSYGGSSAMFTMAALGILQSIYSRRFMF